jgi:hypothetical protein
VYSTFCLLAWNSDAVKEQMKVLMISSSLTRVPLISLILTKSISLLSKDLYVSGFEGVSCPNPAHSKLHRKKRIQTV